MAEGQKPESDGALECGTDDLGVYAWICVDPSVFAQVAVLKTAYWFTERFYVYLSRTTGNRLRVELRHKTSGGTEELVAACREFCNGLLDQAVRQHVLQETSAVRDSLLRKAFFDVQDPAAAIAAQANEGYVPRENQHSQDDPLGIGQHRP